MDLPIETLWSLFVTLKFAGFHIYQWFAYYAIEDSGLSYFFFKACE